MEKGNLSINSENLLPIIKKWLYSDMDIFLRELVSNGCDAITKLIKLRDMGEAPFVSPEEKFSVKVTFNKENKTIKIMDNGIGMTAEEINKYINEIAFSGAEDFIEKYKDKLGAENEIIGHFGLGFYSAFMVSDTVEIDSLSYAEGAKAAKWICHGGIEYEISEGTKAERGTEITLHINEESKDFLSRYKLNEILKKYCSFMPYEIYLIDENEKPKEKEEGEEEEKTSEPLPINDTKPLWLKKASEVTDEEYKEFYHTVFMDFNEPLFWIHLNMDYPFNLKGILYFPKLKNDFEPMEGEIKLYCNQVFVADNVKEVVPEFLLLLKGVLDCPDIPLNVSRSFLQNDANVSKMSGYITRKVADKLNSLFKKDRDNYAKFWDDVNIFIKFGCIKDKSFYDKIKDSLLFKTTAEEHLTLNEYTEKYNMKEIYYASDLIQQSQYIKLFKEQGIEPLILNTVIDNPFISYIESYSEGIKFLRIDAEISKNLKSEEGSSENNETIAEIFKNAIGEDIKIEVETLKSENTPAIVLLSEQDRRMQEMSKMFAGIGEGFKSQETLIINNNNNLVKTLLALKDNENKKEDMLLICRQIYDLAMMSHKPLPPEEMSAFIERNNKILDMIANK
ncbi:MAG: molecular chaperone HtpG [Lachnospiraceae bacterium]|nr:molecular chaperone HtpG [Lachnospiraceae bacterium]